MYKDIVDSFLIFLYFRLICVVQWRVKCSKICAPSKESVLNDNEVAILCSGLITASIASLMFGGSPLKKREILKTFFANKQ